MRKPDMDEIARLLYAESERNAGTLPELYRIAWDSYLTALLGEQLEDGKFSHVDFGKVGHHFPNLETDPDANDPVSALTIGKHYRRDPSIPESEFVLQTTFEGFADDIKDELAYFDNELPPGYIVAFSAKLLALHDCKEINDEEYEKLLTILPVPADNPVKEVEAFMRRYQVPDDVSSVP